jgi:hypothetical protein
MTHEIVPYYAASKGKPKNAALCASLADAPDILTRAAKMVRALGVVGECAAVKLIYLAVTARLFPLPVSVVVKGPSSAGKSWVVKRVLKLFPGSAFYALTAMSQHALFHFTESLKHRILVIYEAAGIAEEQAYQIRTLLSEHELRYQTVMKSGDQVEGDQLRLKGPTGLITTTTHPVLHRENETRLLTVSVTETPEQTAAVLNELGARAAGHTPHVSPEELRVWRDFQEWLAAGETRVVVPYGPTLAAAIPPAAVRLRRDFSQVLTLIRANALLHRATRNQDAEGRIKAAFDDYAVVRELVEPIVSAGVQVTVRPIVRQTVEVVESFQPARVTVKMIADKLGIDESSAWNRVRHALADGYLINLQTTPHRPARLVPGNPMPDDGTVLPQVKALKAAWKLGKSLVSSHPY